MHLSLLAGLLSQIGMKAEPVRPAASVTSGRRPRAEYLGARNARFAIFPGSSLARQTPDWIVAAELVETSRLWARTVASIEPEWIEPLAQHLVRRNYSEPHWERKRGSAVALEKVTLYGVPIVVDRKVNYGRIDPAAARELFIRHALVEGDWQTSHRFFAENRRLLAEAAELEHRVRRRGLIVGEDELFAFYDARVPANVVSAAHFDTWWKQAHRADPDLLTFKPADLLSEDAAQVSTDSYPDIWTSQSAGLDALPLSYAFEPGSETDGVTVDIPLSRLNQVNAAEFSWQVPGRRTELVTEMIRSLPKSLRRDLVPAPDLAREVVARLGPPSGDLRDAVARELRSLRGVTVPRDAWDLSRLPPHLRITVRVTDGNRVLAEGKDVAELQRELRPRLRAVLSQAAAGAHPLGPDLVELRRAACGVPRGHRRRLPGSGRRRDHGRCAPVRDRGRGARGHVGRNQAADPARRALAGQVHRGPPVHPGQAGPQSQPARQRGGHVRRLRELRRRLPDGASRRPGPGPRGLRAAIRRGAVRPA